MKFRAIPGTRNSRDTILNSPALAGIPPPRSWQHRGGFSYTPRHALNAPLLFRLEGARIMKRHTADVPRPTSGSRASLRGGQPQAHSMASANIGTFRGRLVRQASNRPPDHSIVTDRPISLFPGNLRSFRLRGGRSRWRPNPLKSAVPGPFRSQWSGGFPR